MRFRTGKASTTSALVLALSLSLVACGAESDSNGSGAAQSSNETTVVEVGMAPYFEYSPWILADELGLDDEQGLDLQFTSFTSTDGAVISAFRGDIDVAPSCHACTMPVQEQVPTIQDWMITNQFKGFILIGRNGEAVTFDEASTSMSDEEAKQAVLESLEGKQFAMRSSSYGSLVESALEQVGLTLDDVEVLDFPSDSQAAIAYVGGTGDYYIGSLPEEAKMLTDPENYVNVGGTEILGHAGLWFSTMTATEDWLNANEDVALRMLAVWYRTMRYMAEDPETTLPMFTDIVNEVTAASLPVEEVEYITTELERFATLEQAEEEFYNPDSPTYFGNSVAFYVEGNSDVLPADYDVDYSIRDAEYFEKLLADEQLVEWINSPL